MRARRRLKSRLFVAVLISALGIYLFRRFEYVHPSRMALESEVSQRGAGIATLAQIKRDEPRMGQWIEPNAIWLLNPELIRTLPPPG
jgi:hypothetical protein